MESRSVNWVGENRRLDDFLGPEKNQLIVRRSVSKEFPSTLRTLTSRANSMFSSLSQH